MSSHEFDTEFASFVREFEWLTHVLQQFAFECRRVQGESEEWFFLDTSAKMTVADLINKIPSLYEKAVPSDHEGMQNLRKALDFLNQIRERRNDVIHSLYLLHENSLFATKVKSTKNDMQEGDNRSREFIRTTQVLELRKGSLDQLIVVTVYLRTDFERAINHLRARSTSINIKTAFLHSTGTFSVPAVGQTIIGAKSNDTV